MADNRAPFKSGVIDYDALRKRAEELGILKPPVEEKPAPVEPNAPIEPWVRDECYDYGCGLRSADHYGNGPGVQEFIETVRRVEEWYRAQAQGLLSE